MELNDLFNPLIFIPKNFYVLTKADEHGRSDLVPMILRPAQELYLKNRTHRDIAVKPRQQGLSTAVLAVNFHHLLVNPYTRISVIAHKEDTASFLLESVHRFYNHLEFKPEVDWSSASKIRFPILDSLIHVDTASARTIGRGEGLTIAHLTEMSSWYEPKAEELFAGISQTIPLGGFITIESTPKGRAGKFYNLYSAAKRGDLPHFTAHFFPWWLTPEYTLPVEQHIHLKAEESLLMDKYSLTLGQILWRRLKIAELQDLFFQEYPENDVDCWLSSDISVFDGVAIRKYLQQVERGTVDGNLTTWKRPLGGRNYIIGGDVGGGLPRGDFSVAAVLDAKNNDHVATFRARIAPDLYAEELIRLGKAYNMALIAVERNNHGHTVLRILLEHNYPNIYHYRDYDNPLQTHVQPGWLTSGKTRPTMIDNFGAALRSGDIATKSENLLMEASCFQYIGQKPQAPSDGYDDELFAVMIAEMVRETVPVIGIARHKPISYVTI